MKNQLKKTEENIGSLIYENDNLNIQMKKLKSQMREMKYQMRDGKYLRVYSPVQYSQVLRQYS